MKKAVILGIKVYKIFSKWIYASPLFLFSSNCNFYPTCSDYAVEIISKEGVIKGGLKTVTRIFKCNPLFKK